MRVEGRAVSADWADPEYRAARRARAVAYAEFCRVAGANPHRLGQPGFQEHYEAVVVPVRDAFMEAVANAGAEQARVVRESEEAS